MYTYTTPTLKLKFPNVINLLEAENVYVTFSAKDRTVLFTKESESLEIEATKVSVFLTQEETLDLPEEVFVQVNWTYTDDSSVLKRACSEIVALKVKKNLLQEVIGND